MIPLYAVNPSRHLMLSRFVQKELISCERWGEFASRAAAAEVGIMVIEGAQTEKQFAFLESLNLRCDVPTFLILCDSIHNEAPLGKVRVHPVIRVSDIAALTDKQIRRGAHRSTRELESAIQRCVDATNKTPKPFVWTKTAD